MSPKVQVQRRVKAIRRLLAKGSQYLVLTAQDDRPQTRRPHKPKR